MDEQALIAQYEKSKPVLEKFGYWVLGKILPKISDIAPVEKFLKIPPVPRIKETDSFIEKAITRKRKTDPLEEITDQVGVRFVVLLLQDIDIIGEIIRSIPDWTYEKDRDHESERMDNPDYFAYQSDHYVIRSIKPITMDEVEIPANTPCEVQIRTLLQHAYAEMAHGSDYKPGFRLPHDEKQIIRRALAKGSALIETTDDVFREISVKIFEHKKNIISILNTCSSIYQQMTDIKTTKQSKLAIIMVNTYQEEIRNLTEDTILRWASTKGWLKETLAKKRASSVFYRDPIIILLAWIAQENPISMQRQWPIDRSYLEGLFEMMGISMIQR